MRISRREFIKSTTALGVTLGVSPPLLCTSSFAAPPHAAPAAPLAIVKGQRRQAVQKTVALLGGMESFVKKGNRVVLKPNMSWAHDPARATVTHPEVVAAVAELCIKAGAGEVLVLDYTIHRPEPCLRLSGIREACAGMKKVFVLAVNDEKFFTPVPVPRGKVLSQVKLIKDVLTCDVFINIPTAKCHTTTGLSLGMKNLMGVIWDRRYFHSKVDINQALADLSTVVKVNLVVLDASRALTTAGPSGPGKVTYPNTIIAGTDPVAVDAMGVSVASWYGQTFTPGQIKHIAAAHAMGIGTMNLDAVPVLKASV